MKANTAALTSSLGLLALSAGLAQAQYSATYTPSPSGLPKTTENGQSGSNDCGTGNDANSNCQNFYINSLTDFCVWAPPNGGDVATFEREEVAYCTQPGRGTRLIPQGTILGAHFVKTPSYVQITGTGDFTKIGITAGDPGGELDPHGADGNGNPIGGLVFSNAGGGPMRQMHEWMSFMSATQFCTRACFDGDRATSLCRHTYDELGCDFNMPGNYAENVFESCQGNDAMDIMYGYAGLSTFSQADTTRGVQVPSPHPAPASSKCQAIPSIPLSTAGFDGASAYVTPTSSSSSTTSSTTSSSSSSSTSSSSFATSTAPVLTNIQTTLAPSSPKSNISGASSSSPLGKATVWVVNGGVAALVGLAFML